MFVHMLKLVDYLHLQADNPWYNFYLYIVIKMNTINGTGNALNEYLNSSIALGPHVCRGLVFGPCFVMQYLLSFYLSRHV